ncbi:GNAT family N-acetyltransferase [Haloferax namakaokahaiae]|uniref:GNAT family N-acetyltransferase n=1 Tax=Haloferax namakaokahaiae TaxID=1748331 RepID=A0ABD5ZBC9_9EURY
MASTVTVRPATPDERARLDSLQRLLTHPSPELLDSWPTVGTVLVSVDDDETPVGYLLAIGDHLAELVVEPAYRREGRASALIEAYHARRPDAELSLFVHVENRVAQACYESLGFENAGRVTDAFAGEPGVRMVRSRE